MSIEQKINYQLNKYPAVKKVIKSVYQRGMYAVSKKVKSEGSITRVSPDEASYEYFFGYYDKCPWDITDRFIICLRARDTWSDVSPREKADILLIDTEKKENEPGRVRKIAETKAWNVQQSCMVQWLGPDFSSRIIYNDFRDGKYVAVILTLATMEEQIVSMPVYTVSSDGRFALTLDFSRLYNLRPGYGYYNVPECTKGVGLPNTPAVWRVDLETGESIELLKYTDFASFEPRPEMKENGAVHKVNHLMISPDNKRFMVLYRWFIGGRKYTRLITCNIDGTDMYLLSDDDMVSHCFWKDNNHIIGFENKKRGGTGYYLMKDKSTKYYHCWPGITGDGHPSFSPDGSMVVTDTYPNRARIASLKVMDGDVRKRDVNVVARVFAPFKYDNDTRCDLHPRWNHGGDKICFDSVFEGHRGLYYVSIPRPKQIGSCNPLVSVIVPVYKTERYLDRCVQSLLKQTYENLEIILVDDGSPDNCPELCDRYARTYENIQVVHKANGGISSSRNAGLLAAKGEYIAFADSDDWVALDTYEHLVSNAIRYEADVVDVVIAQVRGEEIVENKAEKIDVYEGNKILEHYLYRGLNEQNGAPYSACRKLYKRTLFREDTAQFVDGIVNEDICFNYRILRKSNRIVVSNQVKYFYFQGDESVTTGKCKKRDLDLLAVSNELVKLTKESGEARIIELAKMKQARSDFSLLARIAVAGTDESIKNPSKLVKTLRRRLRGNLVLLWRSPIPLTRKVLSTAFVVNYGLSCKLLRVLGIS